MMKTKRSFMRRKLTDFTSLLLKRTKFTQRNDNDLLSNSSATFLLLKNRLKNEEFFGIINLVKIYY